MREQRVRAGVPELRFLGFEMHAWQIDDLRSLKSVTFFATNPVFFVLSSILSPRTLASLRYRAVQRFPVQSWRCPWRSLLTTVPRVLSLSSIARFRPPPSSRRDAHAVTTHVQRLRPRARHQVFSMPLQGVACNPVPHVPRLTTISPPCCPFPRSSPCRTGTSGACLYGFGPTPCPACNCSPCLCSFPCGVPDILRNILACCCFGVPQRARLHQSLSSSCGTRH